MTLAPIRGAPPGAPIPDFPIEEPRAKPAEPGATPASGEQPRISPIRRRHMPIELGGGGIALTFRVIPELPAIARPSMTVHIIAESQPLGFLQMSAGNARAFLTNLRNGYSPIVATGDEGGTVQVEIEIAEAGLVLLIRKPGHRDAPQRWFMGRLDFGTMADELLADLGA